MDPTPGLPAQQVPAPKIRKAPDFPSFVATWLKWIQLRRSDLSSRARLALLVLADYGKTGEAYPSIAHLADLLGCSESTARKTVRELEAAGLVNRSEAYDHSRYYNGSQVPNRYRLLQRAQWVDVEWKGGVEPKTSPPLSREPEPPSQTPAANKEPDQSAKISVGDALPAPLRQTIRERFGPEHSARLLHAIAFAGEPPDRILAALERTLDARETRNPTGYFFAVLRSLPTSVVLVDEPTKPPPEVTQLLQEIRVLTDKLAVTPPWDPAQRGLERAREEKRDLLLRARQRYDGGG